MKCFSLLAVLSVFGYGSLYSMNANQQQHVEQQTNNMDNLMQNTQQRRISTMNMGVTHYNNLYDAMKGEEYLSCNLQSMVNNYVFALSSKRAAFENGEDIRIIREYDAAISNLWCSLYSEVMHIFASRNSVKLLTNAQLSKAPISGNLQGYNAPTGNALNMQYNGSANQQTQFVNIQQPNTMQINSNMNFKK